jgi:Protein of unknown function (DUF3592)
MELLGHIFILLIFALFCLVGVNVIVTLYADLRTSIKSKHWPRIQAKIIRYEVSQYTTGGQASQTRYGYTTISSYEIHDHFYPNHYAWHGGFTTWETAEQEALRSCPIGEWVELAYNPRDPQQSRPASKVGWDWDSCIGILFGIPFFSVGFGLFVIQILHIFGISTEVAFRMATPFLFAAQISIVMLFLFLFILQPIPTVLREIRQYCRKIKNRNKEY